MSDIFQEVDEGLREQRWRQLARRYAPFAAIIIVLVIGIFAGREWYASMQENRAQQALAAYSALSDAIDARDWDTVREKAEAVRATGHKGYAGLAWQLEAEAALAAGSPATAIEALKSAAEITPLSPLADLARLKAAYLAINENDRATAKSLAQALADDSETYGPHGRELLAAIAFEEGEIAAARNAYETLQLAPTTPPAISRRAREALALIGATEPATSSSQTPATSSPETPATSSDATPPSTEE
jgi:hypothetical protein